MNLSKTAKAPTLQNSQANISQQIIRDEPLFRGGGGRYLFRIKIVLKLQLAEKIVCFKVMKEKIVCKATGHFFEIHWYRNYSIKPPLSFKPLLSNKPPLKHTFLISPPLKLCKNSLFRYRVSYGVFKFNISNVYLHVSQLDDLFLKFCFKILIIVLDLQNAMNVPGTTSPSSSILAPAEENFRMQMSRVKSLQRRKESSID